MKKYLLIFGLICITATAFGYKKMIVGIEGGVGYVLKENHDHFFVEGSVLINIKNNLYVRTEFARISFLSGGTHINIGTMSPVDLMMFFESKTFNPYALAGVNLHTGGGYTTFNVRAGAGVEFKFNEARFFPFVEGVLDLNMMSNGGSTTDNTITVKGGVRIK
ncbi:MAG: hypothetical protein KGZ86_01800 [Candidatus Latescibacteria bacterium]|nr:hypothetical protein [Candidatus Latescibacterota bacterium]